MSLNDLTGDDNTSLSPQLQRARAAYAESARQSPGMRLWTERKKALGFEFFLTSGKTASVIFLTEIEPFLVHRIKTQWVKRGPNGGFAEAFNVACSQHTISLTGAEWDSTGKPCIFCSVIGKPKAINTAKIYFKLDEPVTKEDGTVFQDGIKPLVFWQTEIFNMLIDSAASRQGGGSLIGCKFKVTRSDKEKAARIGDSWVLQDKITKEKLVAALTPKKAEIDKIKFDAAFASMTIEEQRQVLMQHKILSDRGGDENGPGYDDEAFRRYVVRQETPRLDGEEKKAGAGWNAGDLSSLASAIPDAAEQDALLPTINFDADDAPAAETTRQEPPPVTPSTAPTTAPTAQPTKAAPQIKGDLWD